MTTPTREHNRVQLRVSASSSTHQDGQQRADERDGGRHGGKDRVLELLNQPARHGRQGKLRLLEQLQANTWRKKNRAQTSIRLLHIMAWF